MTFGQLIHELECVYGRIDFRERLMLRRAYDVVPEEELEQFEKLKCCGNCKNRDEDIYGRFVCKYRGNSSYLRNDICRCNSKWVLKNE